MKDRRKPSAVQQLEPKENRVLASLEGEAADPVAHLIPEGKRLVEADASRLSDKRLSRVQRQRMAARIGRLSGNQHLQRVIDLAGTPQPKASIPAVQRGSMWDKMGGGSSGENEGKEDEPLEIHEDNLELKSKVAARAAKRIKNGIVPRYEAMLGDPKGFIAIQVAGTLGKALKWAFSTSDSYAGEYLGFKYQPLLLHHIHQVPGLYNKLSVLVGMEPFHARAVRNFLDIEPPQTFDYDMTMQGAGGGEGAEAVALGIDITCKEGGTKLWHALYGLAGTGIGVSAVPVTASIGSASFDTTEFWGAKDFEGGMAFSTVSAGFIAGIGLGAAKISGSGSKDPITVDLTGFTWMSPNLAAGHYGGYLKMMTGVNYAKPSVAAPKAPEINVIKPADESNMVVFEANSRSFPGYGDESFGSILTDIIKRGDYQLTISGSSSYGNDYNQKLLDGRLKEARRAIEADAVIHGAMESLRLPDDRVKIERTVVPKVSETENDDPAMDRAIVIHIAGTRAEKLV